MKSKIFFAAFASILLSGNASALQQDNIQIYMKPDTVKSFELVLPDDLGVLPNGKVEYRLLMEPFAGTWSDLTERRHFSDENNTVIDAVRFSSAGRQVGECGAPFTLTITAVGKSIPVRTITGRACASSLDDIDSQSVRNDSAKGGGSDSNIFDLSLEKKVIYAASGQSVQISVTIQSYFNVAVDLSVEGMTGEPKRRLVEFDSASRIRKASFTLTPYGEAEQNFTITGTLRGCSGSFCSEKVQGKMVISKAVQEESGFSVSLLPANLNIEKPGTVEYTIRLQSKGEGRKISLRLEVPEGVETVFPPQTVEVAADSEKTLAFSATPKKTTQLYSITVVASYTPAGQKEITKKATAYLSTNELFTDAMREIEGVEDYGQKKTAAGLVDEWLAESEKTGENLQGYQTLREKLEDFKSKEGEQQAEESSADEEITYENKNAEQPLNLAILMPLAAVIAGTVAVSAYLIWKRKKADKSFEF